MLHVNHGVIRRKLTRGLKIDLKHSRKTHKKSDEIKLKRLVKKKCLNHRGLKHSVGISMKNPADVILVLSRLAEKVGSIDCITTYIHTCDLYHMTINTSLFCETSKNDIISLPPRGKNWTEFNFYYVMEIIYLLLTHKRDVDWLSLTFVAQQALLHSVGAIRRLHLC